MTVRPIRELGDPVLRDPCAPVTRFGAGLARLVTDLLDTCRLPGRAGLAAPQIGVGLRVFCFSIDGDEGYLINPRLVSSEGSQDGPEGCLSIPGLHVPVARAAQVVAAGTGLDGQPLRVAGTGELARCLQHEMDHLDGRLYLDRLTARAGAACWPHQLPADGAPAGDSRGPERAARPRRTARRSARSAPVPPGPAETTRVGWPSCSVTVHSAKEQQSASAPARSRSSSRTPGPG